MDKCREAFELRFPIPAHWIEFDEKRNKYHCPYVADHKAFEYQAMWEVWQSRQAEVDEQHKINVALNSENIKQRGQITHYMNRCVETHRRIREANKVIDKHDRYIPRSTVSALEKALRGDDVINVTR